jgi:hypothetical protein
MNTATPPRNPYPSLLKRFQSAAIDGVLQLLLLLLFAQEPGGGRANLAAGRFYRVPAAV